MDGERLRHATAQAVSHDARARNGERVEECRQALGVRAELERTVAGRIAAAVAEKVEHHESVTGRHERNHVAPEVARRGEAVDEHHGLARTA